MERGVKLPRPLTEYNASRLGLISIQSRVAEPYRMGWDSITEDGSNSAGIICRTTDPAGVPHGIASDVFSALITEAAINFESRKENPGEIITTPAAIARTAHLNIRARHYSLIDQALTSMKETNYQVFTNWTDPFTRTKRRARFSIIDFLHSESIEHLFNPDQMQRNYRIRLSQELITSIEGALVLAVRSDILTELKSPGARALYRMLETLRRDPRDVTRAEGKIELTTEELSQGIRLLSPRNESAHLLRIITPMLDMLVKVGYLESFDTVGRGWDTRVHFKFKNDGSVIPSRALQLLYGAGVTGANADALAVAHGMEEIKCAIWWVGEKAKQDKTIRNPSGMIVTDLKNGTALAMLPRYRQRSRQVAVKLGDQQAAMVKKEEPTLIPPSAAAGGILDHLIKLDRITAEQAQEIRQRVEDGSIDLPQIGALVGRPKKEIEKRIQEMLAPQLK